MGEVVCVGAGPMMPATTRAPDLGRECGMEDAVGSPFAAAFRSTRMAMLITDPRQPDNPILFVNDAFSDLTGYSREETVGRNCRFLQGPGTDASTVRRIREAVQAGEGI